MWHDVHVLRWHLGEKAVKSFRKYLAETAFEDLPLAPDDVLNAIGYVERLKNDENLPNHVYSFYRLEEYFGKSTGFLFMKSYMDRYIGEKMDFKMIEEIMASAKDYQKLAKTWAAETLDILKRQGGKAGLEGKYRTHYGPLKVKYLEEVGVEAKRVLDTVRTGMAFWKGLKAVAKLKIKKREFKFADDKVHLFSASGKKISSGKFDSLSGDIKQMFLKSVWCANLGFYVLCGPSRESGLPKAQYILVVEE